MNRFYSLLIITLTIFLTGCSTIETSHIDDLFKKQINMHTVLFSITLLALYLLYSILKMNQSTKKQQILHKRLNRAFFLTQSGMFTNEDDSEYLYTNRETLELFKIDPLDLTQKGEYYAIKLVVFHQKYINEPDSFENFSKHIKQLREKKIDTFRCVCTWRVYGDPAHLKYMDLMMSVDQSKRHFSRFTIVRDITKEYLYERELEARAYTDELTKAKNRYSLYRTHINELVGKTICYFDLDDFQYINDTYGHHNGDIILKQLVVRLRPCPFLDEIYRLDSDKFVFILNQFNEDITTTISQIVSTPVHFDKNSVSVYGSFVFAPISSEVDYKLEEVINITEYAMSQMKTDGKNSSVIVDEQIFNAYREQGRLTGLLALAVKNGEIIPYFQPYFDIKTKKIVGYETLMRWKQDGKILTPYSFLDIAVKTGLICDIDMLMFKESLKFLKQLRDCDLADESFVASSNFTATTFAKVNAQELLNLANSIGVPPGQVSVEVTEQLLVNDGAYENIRDIKKAGFKVAIDDFSVGHSSLTILTKLDIDILKIDKSLIDNVLTNKANYEIFKTIVQLGNSLNTKIVSEGIEDIAHDQVLIDNRVDVGQGFFYSRPCDKATILEMIKKGSQ